MMRARLTKIFSAAFALALAAACGGGASNNAAQSNAGAQPSPAQSDSNGGATAAPVVDVPKLSADIERLEKAAERNPADEDTRDELARAYVRRGDAERTVGQPQEALKDYQRALRLDPDNDAAQKNAADTQEQLGGEQQEDENGAPAPLPVTPNVADEDDKPAATPGAKPTPKKQ
jgi:tetratricopeptide (TPR) repeat protein